MSDKKDMDKGIVNIHGKSYMTVARRLELAHEDKALEGVSTECISHDPVVFKATVFIKGKAYTGTSSISLSAQKLIEKENPYEVAETSAVGRALGFAGYGLIDSVATADDMVRATRVVPQPRKEDGLTYEPTPDAEPTPEQLAEDFTMASEPPMPAKKTVTAPPKVLEQEVICEICGQPATERKGTTKAGKPYHGIFCSTDDKSHTRWLWN